MKERKSKASQESERAHHNIMISCYKNTMRHFDWRNLDSCQMSLMLCSLSFKHEMTTSFSFFSPKQKNHKKTTKIIWNHQLSCHTLFTLLLALFSLRFIFSFFFFLGKLHLSIICLHSYQSGDNNKCLVVIVKSVSLFIFDFLFFWFLQHKKCWQHLTFDSSLFSVQNL